MRLLAVILLAALAATFSSTPCAAAEGLSPADYNYRGTAGNETVTTTGDPLWTARAVEASMITREDSGGASGLVLHYQGSGNYYLFLHSFKSSALMIYKRAGGYQLLASKPVATVLHERHVMRAEDDGRGNLTLLWDGTPELTVQDAAYRNGKAGLRVYNQTVEFDEVLVEGRDGGTLLFDDFDDGDAKGWSGGSGWSLILDRPWSALHEDSDEWMPVPLIETGFEGGNIRLDRVDRPNWTAYVTPELKGSSPYRAWFYFRISNLSPLRPTTIVIQGASFAAPPRFSYDNVGWQRFASGSSGRYTQTFTKDHAWIAHSIPYGTGHLRQLVDHVRGPLATTGLLTTSEGGNPVELITITDPVSTAGKCAIWFVARTHAWEASGSWVVDGIARWLVSSDPAALSLRREAIVHVVPIVDIDTVILGGSGKDQQPIDFNRDWRANPHWRAVKEVIAAIDRSAAAGSYRLFVDFHCPGGGSSAFLGVQPQSMVSSEYWQRFLLFRAHLIATAGSGSLPFTGRYSEWGPSYHPLWDQMSFWHQLSAHPGIDLSLTLETPPGSATGYADLARGFGLAVEEFVVPR